MTYTDEEIEAAARAYAKFHGCDVEAFEKAGMPLGDEKKAAMRAALAAVPRVPAGHWMAPDEPDYGMCCAAIDVVKGATLPLFDVYAAMRDVVKGRKP